MPGSDLVSDAHEDGEISAANPSEVTPNLTQPEVSVQDDFSILVRFDFDIVPVDDVRPELV